MIKLVVGLLLLFSPVLLSGSFRKKRLAYVLSFAIAFHLTVALITQLFHIFSYPVILSVHLILLIFILFKFKKFEIRLDWGLVAVIMIAFLSIYMVHYSYSGSYQTLLQPEYQDASNMRYPYPYFADEWYAVSFIKSSIESQSLPMSNPLMKDEPFINFEFPFHSFLSEIVLLLGIDPLTGYTKIAVFSSVLLCVLIYLFLRHNSISRLSSAIAALSLLYVTNGANLPGMWTLIPIVLGTITIVLSWFFIGETMFFVLSFITLLFYPPLVVFQALMFFVYSLNDHEFRKKMAVYPAILMVAGILISFAYLVWKGSYGGMLSDIWQNKILFYNLTGEFIPQLSMFNIIPLSVLLLFAAGLYFVFRKTRWLAVLSIFGLFMWFTYSFATFRFVIEYARVIFFTSVTMVIVAGFGLHYTVRSLETIDFLRKTKALQYLQIAVLIILLVSAFSYTRRDSWKKLIIINPEGRSLKPAAPANRYLTEEDLRIFSNISGEVFLSFPWKGTVIGVATDNYPITTKPGTISMNKDFFYKFMASGCETRLSMAENISYVYTVPIDCPGFELIDTSSEGLGLYRAKT